MYLPKLIHFDQNLVITKILIEKLLQLKDIYRAPPKNLNLAR